MADSEITLTLRKILESLKRNERSRIQVKNTFVNENDPDLISGLGSDYNPDKDLIVDVELLRLIKVEDWFKDGGSALKRTLRKGKGKSLASDSTVKCKHNIIYLDGDPAV
jgi:hypothetical protein